MAKKKSNNLPRDPYKEDVYGIYHNLLIHIKEVLCSSEEPQRKIAITMNLIMRADKSTALLFFKYHRKNDLDSQIRDYLT